MVLKKPLKRGLELVRILNGLNREQLYFFLKKEFPDRNPNADIDKLLRMKLIVQEDSTIFIPNITIEPNIQEAIEIMQSFWNNELYGFEKGEHPTILRFVKMYNKKPHTFYICKDENVSDLRIIAEDAVVIAITDIGKGSINGFENRLEEYTLPGKTRPCCKISIAVYEYGVYRLYNWR